MTPPNNTTKSVFWRGFRAGLPFILVVAPFGLLFGVVGTEAGLSILQVLSFSLLVNAGAAQFSAVALMSENAPTIIVLLTSLAVNLRMAMYSAAMVPHFGKLKLRMKLLVSYFLVDQSFALGLKEFEEHPQMQTPQKVSYFFGTVVSLAPVWFSSTYLGAALGQSIPDAFSLDFAIPICFIALIAPLLRTIPHILAALVSIIAALSLAWVPFSLGLIIAAILAIVVGAYAELKLEGTNDT
jgi:4-azaleucine resistance transporter AzlC